MNQIKEKKYTASIEAYTGMILLVSINYNKSSKEHQCEIEIYEKKQYEGTGIFIEKIPAFIHLSDVEKQRAVYWQHILFLLEKADSGSGLTGQNPAEYQPDGQAADNLQTQKGRLPV